LVAALSRRMGLLLEPEGDGPDQQIAAEAPSGTDALELRVQRLRRSVILRRCRPAISVLEIAALVALNARHHSAASVSR
jgi:hypothetical protein